MASYPMPYPLRRGEYDDSSQFRNPAGTMPFPQPGDMPVGVWQGEEIRVEFKPLGAPPYGLPLLPNVIQGWALWSSPVFDLQPELRGVSNNTGNRSGVAGNPTLGGYGATPMWGSGGAQLRVAFSRAPTGTRFMVYMYEEGNIIDPAKILPITPVPGMDITGPYQAGGSILDGTQGYSTTLNFAPFGSGLRYWRCNLLFIKLEYGSTGEPLTFNLQASMY
jgi:hypothetical protein